LLGIKEQAEFLKDKIDQLANQVCTRVKAFGEEKK
jgi:hypothetical protein